MAKNNKVLIRWVTLGIAIITYTISIGIWIGKTNAKVENLNNSVVKFEKVVNNHIPTIQGDIKEIKTNISWIRDKLGKLDLMETRLSRIEGRLK